jgi:CRP/FNR family transcriptional regulator
MISTPDLEFLANFFEPDLIEELNRCKVVTMDEDSYLSVAGNNIRYIPIVIDGSIKIARGDENGKEIFMYNITPGESCIISITSSLKNSFNNMDSLLAVTEKRTTMVLITDQQIREWHDKYKSWRAFITNLYNERLTDIFNVVDSVAFKSVDQRLIQYLKSNQNEKNEIELTHQEIAFQIGTAREVVSRLLKQLERNNSIKLFRGKIKIVNLKD